MTGNPETAVGWHPISTAPCDDTFAWVKWNDGAKDSIEDLDHDSDPAWWAERGATHWRLPTDDDLRTAGMLDDQDALSGQCAACPVEARSLYAAAHNAVIAFERTMRGEGDAERTARKLAELKEAVEVLRPIVERHFADTGHSRIFKALS